MKYKILKNESRNTPNGKVYRLVALKTFLPFNELKPVKEGDLGGFIGIDTKLSHDDNSWVFDNSSVVSATLSNTVVKNDSYLNGGNYHETTVIQTKCFDSPTIMSSVLLSSHVHEDVYIEKSKIDKCKIVGFKTSIKNSTVTEYTYIHKSDIIESTVSDKCNISESHVANSKLSNFVTINKEVIENQNITGTEPQLNVESHVE